MPRTLSLPSQRLGLVAAAVLVVLAGCGGVLDQRPPSDDRAVQVRSDVLDAVSGVESYRFVTDFQAEASDGEDRETVRMSTSGKVSVADRRLQATTTFRDETYGSYVAGSRIYTECARPWGGWAVENASVDQRWLNLTPLGRQVALLEQSRVYWVGTETVDGREAAVIEARPTARELQEHSSEIRGGVLTGSPFENATLRVWVDTETHLPVKTVLSIDVRKGGSTATATATTTFSAYGEPVSVSVPSNVTEAPWSGGCPGDD